MPKKVAVYAVTHQEPPQWDFRKSEINTNGFCETIRRRVGYILVPNDFGIFPGDTCKKNRIHPELKLCQMRPHKGPVTLNIREAIERFGPVKEEIPDLQKS
jgi:hypothetical protein